jgi:hypothetical protein
MNKIQNSFTLLTLVSVCLLSSCRKSYSVVGTVYNAVNNEPVENVEVVFSRNVSVNNTDGKPIFTNTNFLGNYRFSLKVRPTRAHKIKFNGMANEDFFFLEPYERTLANGGISYTIDLPFIPIRNVTVTFEDTLKVSLPSEKSMYGILEHNEGRDYFTKHDLVMVDKTQPSTPYVRPSIRLLQGWNHMDGKSYRNDGTIYTFKDSIFVDVNFQGTQNWQIRY